MDCTSCASKDVVLRSVSSFETRFAKDVGEFECVSCGKTFTKDVSAV